MSHVSFFITDKHLYFMIKNEVLYEVYETLNGERVRHRIDVEGLEDCDKITPEQLKEIEKLFLV